MKKTIYLLFFLFSFNLILKSQPCSNFNSSMGNWTITNGWNYFSTANPIDASQFLSFGNTTLPPNAVLGNSVDYANLGSLYLNQCIRFDYNVFVDGVPGSTPIFPRIYVTDGINTVYWESSVSILENSGTGWLSLRAPIQLTASPTSPLPSNADGAWYAVGTITNADFDNVLMNSTNVYFMSLAAASQTQGYTTQEYIGIDNVCVVNCSAPCNDFNAPAYAGNWVGNFCTENYTNINPLDGSTCATLTDNAGPSWYGNRIDFNNIGSSHLNKCLCFDYNVTDDGIAGSSPAIFPTIYLTLGSDWIAFQSNTAITEGTTWVHVCANLQLATTGLPSNADGNWIMNTGMTLADFNNVMLNNTYIGFPVDVAGSTMQTEDIRVDNVCVVDCVTSCNANFEFNFVINSDPAALNNYIGSINITALNPSSTYVIDWGDFTSTTLPPPHLAALQHTYAPGSYVVCVTEKMADGTTCTKCIRICVPDRLPDVSHGTGDPDGTSTGAAGNTKNKKAYINPASNEMQDKLRRENGSKLFIYPNPTSDNTRVDFKVDAASQVTVKVLDILGNVVLNIPTQQYEAGKQQVVVNTKDLASGVYTIVVTVGENEISEKLSIIK